MRLSEDGLIQNPHLDGAPFAFPGGPVGVLLIHGYTATPAEMRLVGDYLAEQGYTVRGIRLPGHGTHPDDLAQTSRPDWIRAVEEGFHQVREASEQVFVCGESLGGLLAFHLAAVQADVAGVVALSPAVRATNRLLPLAPLLKHFYKFRPKGRGGNGSIADERWQGYTVDVVSAAAELLALQRLISREAEAIKAPVLILQSRLDETVDQEAVERFFRRLGSPEKSLVFMEESGHCVALDQECELAAQFVAEFIQRVAHPHEAA